MKRWKKIVLLIFSFNILFFAVDSKKREAEAFAVSTAAMVLGGLAIVGVGATLLSRNNADSLGSSIANYLGDTYDEAVSFNTVTETGVINVSPALKVAMNRAIGAKKSSLSTSKAKYERVNDYYSSSSSIDTGVRVSTGDLVRISFSYRYVGSGSSNPGTQIALWGRTNNNLITNQNHFYGLSGQYNRSFEITGNVDRYPPDFVIYGNDYVVSNLSIVNVTTASSPKAIEYEQYKDVPANDSERLTLIDNTVTKNQYVIDGSAIQENVSSLAQLEAKIDEIGETQEQTNISIGKIFGALGNMPAAIATGIGNAFGWLKGLLTDIWNAILGIPAGVAGAMSGLWEDAGLVWSGIKDSVNATNNWLNNVLTGALDGLSNGIDNLSRVFQDTWAGIEAGLANIANKIGAGVSTGVVDLTGVIDKIGSIPMDLIGLIIPSDWSGITDRVDSLMFNVAENPFKEFMDSLSAVFAKRKSIFDLRVTYYGKVYPLVPLVLKPALDTARTFLTGAVMLISLTLVYVRAKGISWWK